MTWAVYLVACSLFYLTFIYLRIMGKTVELLGLFRSAGGVMSDRDLTDLQKERQIRATALRSMRQTIDLFLRVLAVLACAALPVLISTSASGMDFDGFLAFSLDPFVLVGTVLALTGLDRVRRTFSE